MTKEEKVKLNDQLNSQYAKISELEDKIEDLKKQKVGL
jgi:peptidoglycan hydrolase CwlO-like protein